MELKKLRIAIVVNDFPNLSQTFILNQITDLIDKGHDVSIFAYSRREYGKLHKTIIDYGLLKKCNFYKMGFHYRAILFLLYRIEQYFYKFKLLSKSNSVRIKDKLFYLRYSFIQPKRWFLSRDDFDIIHVHFGFNAIPVVNLKKKGFLRDTKIVISFHGVDLAPLKLDSYKILYKKLFDHSDALTVNTPYLKNLLVSVCSNTEKIFILPVGLDTKKFNSAKKREEKKKESPFRILFCGRLIRLKGPHIAVEIIRTIIKDRNYLSVELRIIGGGAMTQELYRLISLYQIEKNVLLLGELDQESIIKEMDMADLFLLPGLHDIETGRAETQGLVVQEAQSMELPVIVSDVGGLKYGIRDGETGFIVKENDINSFADKIEFLINNPGIRKELGHSGRQFVKDNFDNALLGNQLVEIYMKC